MNKRVLIIFGFLLASICVTSQEVVTTYYNSEWKITKENKATYFRKAVYDQNTFKLNGKVQDFLLKGTLMMEGAYKKGEKSGAFVFNYRNGKLRKKGNYLKNRRVGKWEYYYKSGQLKQIVLFNDLWDSKNISVMEFYSKEGNQLIKDGNGKWVNDSIQSGLFDSKSLKRLTGSFKKGLKNGQWKLVRITDNKLMHTESFKKGKFLKAKIYNSDKDYYGTITKEMVGKIPDESRNKLFNTENFKFDKNEYPEGLESSDIETIFETITGKEFEIKDRIAGYKYGNNSLKTFLSRNIIYPLSAIKKRASGRVYVSVIIDANGNSKSVKLKKGKHKDLDKEAVRVVKLVDAWLPKIYKGKAVESVITIPVNFSF